MITLLLIILLVAVAIEYFSRPCHKSCNKNCMDCIPMHEDDDDSIKPFI